MKKIKKYIKLQQINILLGCCFAGNKRRYECDIPTYSSKQWFQNGVKFEVGVMQYFLTAVMF